MRQTRKNLIRAAAISLALTAPVASAVDIGVGASLNNEGGGDGGYGVSLPLRFGNITVEPELSFYRSSRDITYTSAPTNNYKAENSQYTLDTGIYWRQQVVPALETYVGGRVGYTKNKYSYKYLYIPNSDQSSGSSGFYLGPTLGAEYFFDKHFSLGLDVSLLYESTSGESVSGSNVSNQDGNNLYYQTRARLRFYF
jgi:hypothetical protein